MGKPELTKRLIADTFKQLITMQPLDKISISDIVNACGLNRKTFYYHFEDKQALICWIFDREFESLVDVNRNNTVIDELIDHLHENRAFYAPALTSDVQNNLSEHIYRIIKQAMLQDIARALNGKNLPDNKTDWIANFFANATVGSIKQWASAGMKRAHPESYADSFGIAHECLEWIVLRHAGDEKGNTKKE